MKKLSILMRVKAEIIAIGSELLIGHVVNSNAKYLSEELNAIGISVHFHTVVGDNPERIKAVLDIASKRSDLIITTGGLGPTADDISHEVIAEFYGLDLKVDQKELDLVIKKYGGAQREVPQNNYKQAQVFNSGRAIPNAIGTAIGALLEIPAAKYDHDLCVATFPGVPVEMESMYEETLAPYLRNKLTEQMLDGVIVSRKVRMTGITESKMAQLVLDVAQDSKSLFDSENPSVAPYATLGECYLRITAKAATEHAARNLIQPMQFKIENILADYIFGYDDDTIPSVLAKKLINKNLTIAFAESCTGGLLSKLMTDIPGSSAYTQVNLVTYSNDAKQKFLGVQAETLAKHGAVSAEVVTEMLSGLEKISQADINVAVTGIAGPDGATEEKPIGTIYLGVSRTGAKATIELLDWTARKLNREQIRILAAKKILWRCLQLLNASI